MSGAIQTMGDAATDKRRSLVAPIAAAFLASMCVMAVEVTAGRIVAKEMGSSLYTWTSVIGVVLAGITLGNAIGGCLADRFRPQRLLSGLFVLSSASCLFIPVLNSTVDAWSFLWSLSWPLRVAGRVTIVFLLPAMVLGMIGPVAAKMALDLGRAKGRTVGDVYAWGNVGSILGTFLAGFWLIAWVGMMGVIWLVAGILAVLAVAYAWRSWWPYAWGAAAGFLAVCAFAPTQWATDAGSALLVRRSADPSILYRDESQYSYISVMKAPGSGDKRNLVLDKLIHSTILMENPDTLQYPYESVYAALTYRLWGNKSNLRTLTVGGGGYCFPHYLERHWPDGQVDVAEIDPAVTAAAMKAFGLPSDTKINMYHMDGRNLIEVMVRRKRNGESIPAYDLIYGDAVNDVNVPFHLTTVEYNRMVRELLAPDGMYLVNLIDIFESGRFLSSVVSTFRQSFPNVYVIVPKPYGPVLDRNVRDTFIVVGSMRPLDLTDLGHGPADRVEYDCTVLDENHLAYLASKGRGQTLTDDWAPVEHLLAPVVRRTSADQKADMARRAAQLLKAERWQEAETLFRQALELDPRYADARSGLVRALVQQGRTDDAMAALSEMLKSKPNDSFALTTLGRLLTESNRIEEAIKRLEQAIEVSPDSAQAHFLLGRALSRANRLSEARESFRQAVSLDPRHVPARLQLARQLVREEKVEEAVEQCRAIVRERPSNAEAREMLGRALLSLRRYADAIEAMNPLADLPDAPADALNALAWALATCPEPRHRNGARAVDLAQRACRLTGNNDPYFLGTLAAAYAETGRFDKAIEAVKQSITLAEQKGNTKVLYDGRNHLKRYESGQPFHEQ